MFSEDRKAISNDTDNCRKITGQPRYKNIPIILRSENCHNPSLLDARWSQ